MTFHHVSTFSVIVAAFHLFACGDATVVADSGVGQNDASIELDLAIEADACVGVDLGSVGTCATESMPAFDGKYQVVLRTLALGNQNEGFDLNNADCDGDITTDVDNVLWTLGPLASTAINESMEKAEIVVPMEFYGLDDLTADDCFNFAVYYGKFPPDKDGDGHGAGGATHSPGRDCNDTDVAIKKGSGEVPGNGVDDNCNGLADEDTSSKPPVPSADTTDADGDGQSIADGDCDDRKGKGEAIKKGASEICNDGLDNDCNGYADDGCLPWSEGQTYPLEAAAIKDGAGVINFRGAKLTGGHFFAGPSTFSVSIALDKNTFFDLNLSHVFMEGDISAAGEGINVDAGMLTGVLSAQAMDQAPNLIAEIAGGAAGEDGSLLDVAVGPAGQLLTLPTDVKGRRIPDVDVDGDGVERFEDRDLDGDTTAFRVDTCIDGDGTEVKDEFDADGKVTTPCTMAKDASGNYRFVDGWSIAIKFTAVPTTFEGTISATP
jgi:hypothetical protein